MSSSRSLAVVATLAASALAQSSTSVTSLFLYGFEGDNLVASVVAVAPQATTYFVTCAPGTDGSDCGFGPGVSFTEGPSTLGLHVTESGAFSMDVDCSIASQTATCVETDAGPEANSPGTLTSVVSDISNSLAPVTITAGLSLLSASVGATTTGSAGASGPTTSTSASTGASATSSAATKTASSSASHTSASGTSAATGAAHKADRKMGLMGAAGLVGMAMVL